MTRNCFDWSNTSSGILIGKLYQHFWLMQMDLCLDVELSMVIFKIFFSLKFGPNEKKLRLASMSDMFGFKQWPLR